MNDPVHLTLAEAITLLSESASDTATAFTRLAAELSGGSNCSCNGTGLRLGGWIPTIERPFPDPCPSCTASLTPRQRQVLQAAYLLERNPNDPVVRKLLARNANDLTFPTATAGLNTVVGWSLP